MLLVKRLAGWHACSTSSRHRHEAGAAAKQSETPVVGSLCAHVSFKCAKASVLLDVDCSSVLSTTRRVHVNVYLYPLTC